MEGQHGISIERWRPYAKMRRVLYSIFFLLTTIIVGCNDNQRLINSETYFKEEVAAYNDILPEVINAEYWTKTDSSFALFFVFDSLAEVTNEEKEFLTGKFEKRQIGNLDLNPIPKIKLRLVTNFINEKRIVERMDSTLKTDVSIRKNEEFTGDWLILSRICFDKTFSKGFLTDSIWSDKTSSRTDFIEIQKRNNKWEVKRMIKGLVY